MAVTPRLEVRQVQGLALTPQLMQSIRLLQLSHLELNQFVEAELLSNPLLEREDGTEIATADLPEQPGELSAYEDMVAHGERFQDADSIAAGLDTAVENVFPEQTGSDALGAPQGMETGPSFGEMDFAASGGTATRSASGGGEGADLDQFVASRPSLADHLTAQIGFILIDPADRMIASHLIDGVDEAGYLRVEPGAIADQLGAAPAHVEAVLARLQGCDPVGVFARSLPECLAIQLREKNHLDPLMARLLEHLDLLAAQDMAGLMRAVGAQPDDLADMIAELRDLDPRPGRAFDGAPVHTVVPDVFVREGAGGGWAIELNTEVLPKVLVNRVYYAKVSAKARDNGEKTFLTDCLHTATWLTRSLDQRAQTILKVATEIVRQQDGFLLHGVSHLKPMTLKMVADTIDMHESTVSRVTSNKYIETPRGLFELKYFFTTALSSTTGGADHSAEAVRHRIRQLIEAEAPDAILSDDTLAETLKREQNIDIARRTVAKYREGMNIPSSVIRRRQKRALASTS